MQGSYVGMIKKIFKDTKEPLFGRATMLFNLKAFSFFDSFTFLNAFFDLETEDASKFYFIFGGVPKYLLLAGQMGTRDPVETFKKLFLYTHVSNKALEKNISLLGFYRLKRNEEIGSGKIFKHNRSFLPSGRTHQNDKGQIDFNKSLSTIQRQDKRTSQQFEYSETGHSDYLQRKQTSS